MDSDGFATKHLFKLEIVNVVGAVLAVNETVQKVDRWSEHDPKGSRGKDDIDKADVK